ncbi:hypothetical protein [Microbulbifer agarilyticus]
MSSMKNILFIFLLMSPLAYAEQDLKSCLTYSFGKIKDESAKHILRNIFNDQLFRTLKKEFPAETIDFTNWVTETNTIYNEEGSQVTYLKGCFIVNDIYMRTDLVWDIMRVADKRAQAAFKFYFKRDEGDFIDNDDRKKVLDGMEKVWGSKEYQEYMRNHAKKHGL